MKSRLTLEPLQNRIKEDIPPETIPLLKITGAILPILIYNVACQAVIFIFAYFMQMISANETGMLPIAEWIRLNSTLVSGIVKGLSLVIGAAVVFTIFLKEKAVIRLPAAQKKDIGILFFLGASAALAVNILFALTGFTGSSANYEQVAEQQFSFPLWAGIILYGIVAPIAEEIVFRGIVYNRLRRHYPLAISLVCSGLLFGMYHGNMVQAVYGFLLGVLIVALYEKYGSFLVPVLLHSAANISVYAVTSNIKWQNICMNWLGFLVSAVVFMILLVMCLAKNKEE